MSETADDLADKHSNNNRLDRRQKRDREGSVSNDRALARSFALAFLPFS